LGLEVRHIVVLGHAQCGGIKASLEGGDLGHAGYSFIDSWVDIVRPARDKVLASASQDPQRDLELEAIRVSLANLRSFPFIAAREQSEQLKLHGAYFGISDGNLYVLNNENDSFEVQ
jgi:carbonic anhydrase